jgi:hypothetical protein
MRKVSVTVMFLLFSLVCGAPNLDFRVGLQKIRSMRDDLNREYHEKEFTRFINDLGYTESGNNWLSMNCIGCFGEWQFSESTLRFLGYHKVTLKKFKEDPGIFPPDLQLKALKALIKVNMSFLMNYQHFIGDSIKGIRITRSGMIAASHLGGAKSLQQFLDSKGRINVRDILGTSISDYLRKFSSYDLDTP